jgi:hypothetical protein
MLAQPTRRQARANRAASRVCHRARVIDLAWLRHPSERSRLVLAVAASVVLVGVAVVLFAKRLERDHVLWTMGRRARRAGTRLGDPAGRPRPAARQRGARDAGEPARAGCRGAGGARATGLSPPRRRLRDRPRVGPDVAHQPVRYADHHDRGRPRGLAARGRQALRADLPGRALLRRAAEPARPLRAAAPAGHDRPLDRRRGLAPRSRAPPPPPTRWSTTNTATAAGSTPPSRG